MSDKDYLIKGEMYQYNLGWLIEELMSFKQDLATAIDLKTIKYADPIQWDITTQYPANTVVVDPKSGTAYMSKVPVPAGVELDNTNYWVVVFNYQDIYNKIMDGVAFNDRDQDYATKDLLVNDLVWYAGDLYRVTRAIPNGSKYIPETNLIKTSIESLLVSYYGRDRTAQISNDTVNVSGDYTLVAGDIAETSTNSTIKVTKDREIDVDGADSLHIDGVSTVNVGGLRTEVYAGDKTEKITGTTTEEYTGTHTENHAGKKIVNAMDIVLNPTEPLTYGKPEPLDENFGSVDMKSTDGAMYKLLAYKQKINTSKGQLTGRLAILDYVPELGYQAQGMTCVDNTCIIAYANNTATNDTIIAKYDLTSGNFLTSVKGHWYHANSLVADVDNDLLYSADALDYSSGSWVGIGSITVFKLSTLEFVKRIQTPATVVSGLGFVNGTLYITDSNKVYSVDTVTGALTLYTTMEYSPNSTFQGFYMTDTALYWVRSSYNAVLVYDHTGKWIDTINIGKAIPFAYKCYELESVYIDGNHVVIDIADYRSSDTDKNAVAVIDGYLNKVTPPAYRYNAGILNTVYVGVVNGVPTGASDHPFPDIQSAWNFIYSCPPGKYAINIESGYTVTTDTYIESASGYDLRIEGSGTIAGGIKIYDGSLSIRNVTIDCTTLQNLVDASEKCKIAVISAGVACNLEVACNVIGSPSITESSYFVRTVGSDANVYMNCNYSGTTQQLVTRASGGYARFRILDKGTYQMPQEMAVYCPNMSATFKEYGGAGRHAYKTDLKTYAPNVNIPLTTVLGTNALPTSRIKCNFSNGNVVLDLGTNNSCIGMLSKLISGKVVMFRISVSYSNGNLKWSGGAIEFPTGAEPTYTDLTAENYDATYGLYLSSIELF